MKKQYSKPTVELVDFSLSSSIAGSCGEYLEYQGAVSAGFFASGPSNGCPIPTSCYHVPSDSLAAFAS